MNIKNDTKPNVAVAVKRAVPRVIPKPERKTPPPIDQTDKAPNLFTLQIPKGASNPTLAKLYKVGRSTIHRWKEAGLDVYHPPSIAAYLETQNFKPKTYRDEDLSKMDYNAARTRKMVLEGTRIERMLDREEGEWTPNAIIREDCLAAASQLKIGFAKFEVELPPMLVGLNEAQMQVIIRKKTEELLLAFTTKTSKLYLANG